MLLSFSAHKLSRSVVLLIMILSRVLLFLSVHPKRSREQTNLFENLRMIFLPWKWARHRFPSSFQKIEVTEDTQAKKTDFVSSRLGELLIVGSHSWQLRTNQNNLDCKT